jgi:phenylpropionate dioxygenase-like ring-hydroxylating dioxygenase large terminal subunit
LRPGPSSLTRPAWGVAIAMGVIADAADRKLFGSFIDDGFMAELDRSTIDVADARFFPSELYTSEEWFRFEQRAIFERSWLCVGRVDQIPAPGDFLTITINDDPLLVIRGADGEIRVMSNVCRHRGHVLAEGTGNARHGLLRCPLHYWSYDTTGQVMNTPEMDRTNFDKSTCRLPMLKTEIWNGFIFAHFDPGAEPLAPTLAKLDEEMRNYNMTEMINLPPLEVPAYPWNWKLMLENFMEPYHNAYLHKGIHDFALGHGFCEHSPDENVIMHPTGFDRKDGAFNPLHSALLPPIENLTEEQRRRVMFAMVPPMMPLGLVPDHMFYFLIMPHGANEISLRISICVPPDSTRVKNFERIVQWIVDGVMMYNDQDVRADTAVQRGLRSRMAPRGPFSWKETTIVQLNRWLVRRYRSYAEELGLIGHRDPAMSASAPFPSASLRA